MEQESHFFGLASPGGSVARRKHPWLHQADRVWNPHCTQCQLFDLGPSGPQLLTCEMEITVGPVPWVWRGLKENVACQVFSRW